MKIIILDISENKHIPFLMPCAFQKALILKADSLVFLFVGFFFFFHMFLVFYTCILHDEVVLEK